jgi:hypothetical protein
MGVPASGVWQADDVERGFGGVSRVLGFDSDYHRGHLTLLHPPRISQQREVVVPAGWHAARRLGFITRGVLEEQALSWEIEIPENEC